jgi:hypothetical protein
VARMRDAVACKILVLKPEEKRPFGKPNNIW